MRHVDRYLVGGVAIVVAGFAVALTAQQSQHALFERARLLEDSNQDLAEAITLYEQVVDQAGGEHALAATARLRVGLIYERLGRPAEAEEAYGQLLRAHPASPAAAEARVRLAAHEQGATAVGSGAVVARQAWSGRDANSLGTPSLDGRYLSAVDDDTGDLVLRDLVGGETRRLTKNQSPYEEGGALFSVISPDGRSVAYSWYVDSAVTELRTIRTDGSQMRVLGGRPDVLFAQPFGWSLDGAEVLAVFERRGGTVEIAMVSVANGAVRVLKSVGWQGPARMSLSPDGRFIAYDRLEREDASTRDIYLLATDGSREAALVRHSADDHSPVWTPDGTGVLFLSDRTGVFGAWVMPVQDGAPTGSPRLSVESFGGSPMGFTESGALYYSRQTGIEELYTATLDLETGRLVDPPAPAAERFVGSNNQPDWSPDGLLLSYTSHRNPATIVIRTLDTGRERELVPNLGYFHRPRWSPDGGALWAHGFTTRGVHGWMQIDIGTGEVTRVVRHAPDVTPSRRAWSPDGRTSFYPTGQPKRIVAQDMESERVRDVYHLAPSEAAISDISVSPDGRSLVATVHGPPDGASSVKLIPTVGGEARDLVMVDRPHGIRYFGGLSWTPDGRHVLLVRARDDPDQPAELWKIAVADGAAEQLELAMPGLRYVRLHPDGRRIVFNAGRTQEEV